LLVLLLLREEAAALFLVCVTRLLREEEEEEEARLPIDVETFDDLMLLMLCVLCIPNFNINQSA
jgi:hypothetical protein